MEYVTPELRKLGSFASLTLGNGGSCSDGGTRVDPNVVPDQVGGGDVGLGTGGKNGCGSSN